MGGRGRGGEGAGDNQRCNRTEMHPSHIKDNGICRCDTIAGFLLPSEKRNLPLSDSIKAYNFCYKENGDVITKMRRGGEGGAEGRGTGRGQSKRVRISSSVKISYSACICREY